MIRVDNLRSRPLYSIVENRTVYSLGTMELNLFETFKPASVKNVYFEHPLLATMIRGRKVVELGVEPEFAFLPGESFLLPANASMTIELPDASERHPTKCLALEIDESNFQRATQLMNERRLRINDQEWSVGGSSFHFMQEPVINHLLQRLVFLCTENHASKDLFVGSLLQELIVRLHEAESRAVHLDRPHLKATENQLSAVITYIRNHLDEKLSVQQLSRIAYMSETAFYQAFRNELGCSPVEFINETRMRLAANLLHDAQHSIREVAMCCGFNSVSYFTRTFGEHHGTSPGSYQMDRALPRQTRMSGRQAKN